MKRSLLRPVVSLMLVIFVVAGCAAPAAPVAAVPPTATTSPLDVARAYSDALAKGDTDAALALFIDTAQIVDEGSAVATGRAAIRDYLIYVMALEYRELDGECVPTQTADLIKCQAQEKMVMIPVGKATITYYVEVKEGKIATVHLADDWDAVATANFTTFITWLLATHPDDHKHIFDSVGKNEYSRELGELIAGAYHEWEATKLTPTRAPAAADPLDVVAAFRDALAERDADKMVALFTDSAQWQGLDGRVISGPTELRNDFEYLLELEYAEVAVECQPEDAQGVTKCEGGFKLLIWGDFQAAYSVLRKGEKIDRFYWTMYSWADVEPRIKAFLTWAEGARPEDMALVYKKENAWAFDRTLGELIKKLYTEWQAVRLTPTPAAVTADPLKVVAAFRAALAKHDVDKMIALFAEDGEWRHNDYHTFTGPTELRNVLNYAVALDYKEQRGACTLAADKARARCKVQARNIPYGNFLVMYDVEVAGDKISTLQFTESLDAATQARADEFLSWVRTAHPEDMARIDAEFGKYAFSQELGEAIATLHAEWQAAKPTPVPAAAAVPDVVQKFRDAMADRDIEAVIALFTDTGEWRHNGSITFRGRAELEPWLGYLWGLRYRELEATCEATSQPALTKCESRLSAVPFGECAATYYIEVTEGKISAVIWQDNVGPEADARATDFLRWLADTHPEENARIWEGLGNKSGYNQALGESINKAYEEWRATQQLGVDVSVRIMPLGDSITEGLCDTTATCNVPGIRRPTDASDAALCDWSLNDLNPKSVGYRAFLRDKLAAAGVKASFVGSVDVAADLAHEGHSGWTIGDLDFCVENANWLEETQPDIILLHIGTNDMGWAHPPDQMLDDLRLLLEHIYAHAPKTHVIVAQVMAVTSNLRSFYVTLPELGNDTLAKYNAGIPDVVADFQRAGFNVSLVDMTEVIESDADFDAMGLHPTGKATERIADVWLEEVTEILAQ